MADGFIVRRGGKAKQTATPSILDFSTVSATSIKFKLRNNDAATATLVYRFGTVTGEGDSISVAANTTTSEITLTVPTITAPTKLFVTANAVGKVKSEVAEQEFQEPVIYTAATGGTTNEYDDGGKRYKSHTFTSNGTFTVTTVGDAAGDRNKVDYLIIAGGGGGGGTNGGGGGAGGFRTTLGTQGGNGTLDSKVTVTATSYGVTIGLGGSSNSSGATSSVSFPTTITSTGGGAGGNNTAGANGGSGGGGAGGASFSGGTGTTDQGTNGAAGVASGLFPGGGGGGAGQAATNANGGNGLANLLRTGSNETRAGGGGGGTDSSTTRSSGGSGGGGEGGINASGQGDGLAGTTNTGSGGGGGQFGQSGVGGSGGSGIVVIRYEIAPSV